MGFAKEVCDRVVFMADGEIIEQGKARKSFVEIDKKDKNR